VEVPPALVQAVGGHRLVAETLVRRGVRTASAAGAFLYPEQYTPATPDELPDLERAAVRLRQAIRDGDRIAVWGDFDADGQTATAVLLETFRGLGGNAIYHIPTRQQGHGVQVSGVDALAEEGARLLVTCDTGVAAHAAVTRAGQRGLDVIITDHHVPGDHLPAALSVVNPHRLPSGHPMETLVGVGVAYQLARALDGELADSALDLVALGSVADVATVTGDTRYLVQRGLAALSHTRRPGLRAIYASADLHPQGITEEQIGFVLAPRLNALGRLADAAHGVELLTTRDATRARILAGEVEALNAQRQWLTRQVTEGALAQIERHPALLSDYHAVVLEGPTWPSGVVGIVAGRLAERVGKPVVLVSTPPGQVARGSGRSIPGVNLVAALRECAPLLESYGGHAGAAGFAIQPEKIPQLRHALSRALAKQFEALPKPTLQIDAYVRLPDPPGLSPEGTAAGSESVLPTLNLHLVREINRLAPFGPGNPPLVLGLQNLRRTSAAVLGRTGEHRRVTVEDAAGRSATVFWWHGADWPLPDGTFDLALTARASDYRGLPEVQLEWIAARVIEPAAAEVVTPWVQVHDLRQERDPQAEIRRLGAEGIPIWAEAALPTGVESLPRHRLRPSPALAIWTLPPGPAELRAALKMVEPEQVYLFGKFPPPGPDASARERAEAFLRRLAGLVKHALRSSRDGQVTLLELAAATAEREATVQAGLDWLAAQGQIQTPESNGLSLRLRCATQAADPQATEAARGRLDALLSESDAFRRYLSTAPAGRIETLAA
jgi:single-stranded-DNA-specific exonuclease